MRRIPVKYLSLSAAALVALLASENFVSDAMIPTKNDRWTVGFGSTFRDDGAPVKKGDTIKPVPAIKRSHAHIQKDESGIKRCVTADLTQYEYDVMVDFAYQYGVAATCKSSMVRHSNAGRYTDACNAYLLYKRSGGFDCSIPGNRVCAGVWTRNQERRLKCLGKTP